ncbi:MAG TPA: YbhB/YbcL family Raf kinase inhibitor-like protein [Solirubrobacteraceae bacterium]|jgi:hypothetical protein|nr:YbhB/YbcL family Raf kinase inhibitor-like protein [Solirubrobacteraceae bacterium]
MGRRFVGQDRFGVGGARRAVRPAGVASCLCAIVAIAGCGESSGGKAASVVVAKTAATTATAPTTPTTPATTSTATKPPAKSSKSSTTPAKTTTTPAATTSPKPGKPSKGELGFGKIKVTSTAFKAGGPIAAKYTCDGGGTSPPLQWHGVPRGTSEVLMLALDLSGSANDAIQWAVAGISPNATGIPEGSLPAGAVAGVNSAGKIGWGGICGSKGQLHHVGFLFYALKHKLSLKSGFNPVEVRSGLKGATLATGLTLATYQRP